MYNKTITIRVDKTLGYQYFMDRDHPLASKVGRVYLHRHIASIKAGRWLMANEHVHHKDGKKSNNSPANLLVLSGVEHKLLHDAASGKNPLLKRSCAKCGGLYKPCREESTYCSPKCAGMASRRVSRPGKKELRRLVWERPTEILAKEYGVSGVAIAKWCRLLGIPKPPRGYWAKKKYKPL